MLTWTENADAHRLTRAHLEIDVGGPQASTTVTLKLRGRRRVFAPLLARSLGAGDRPTAAQIQAGRREILWAAATHLTLYDATSTLCKVRRRALTLGAGDEVRVVLVYHCPESFARGAPLELRDDLFFATDPDHQVFVTLRGSLQRPGVAKLTTLDARRRTLRFSRHLTVGTTLWRFFHLGVVHIFGGTDHILFLLALLLAAPLARRRRGGGKGTTIGEESPPGASWRASLVYLLKIVSTFTIAHSLTLAASGLGWVRLPSKLVESVIAASIVWVAIENIVLPRSRYRIALVFVFGLAHGFGFADILAETGLPPAALLFALLSFNVGVEVGQLMIVALAFPIIIVVARAVTARRGSYRWVLWGGSAIVAICGAYWLVTRLLA